VDPVAGVLVVSQVTVSLVLIIVANLVRTDRC
jgi:hypothetical protein